MLRQDTVAPVAEVELLVQHLCRHWHGAFKEVSVIRNEGLIFWVEVGTAVIWALDH